jgi:HEAT repeat protein
MHPMQSMNEMERVQEVSEEPRALAADADPVERRERVYETEPQGDGIGTLMQAMQDPEVDVRLAAVTQLGTGEGPEVTEALVMALSDADSDVIEEALDALESTADARIVPALFALLGHSDPRIRERARDAIEYVQD